jgi:hypothetical protein
VGEIEPLEGLQDLENMVVNSRIDNVRLVLQAMFAVNVEEIEDLRDLRVRPGGIIRVKNKGMLPAQAVHRVDFGQVNPEAFKEASEAERLAEKVSGVSAYQTGTDNPNLNDTATGVALISEQGNARFALKTTLAELTGLTRVARHFGAIIQQFWDTPRVIRMLGPRGAYAWQTLTPEGLQGALDYDIEAASTTQTDTIRRQQTMSLFQLLFGILPPQGQIAMIEDVLEVFGKKDTERYMGGMEQMLMQQQLQQQMQSLGAKPEDFLSGMAQSGNGQPGSATPPAPPTPATPNQPSPAAPMQQAIGIGA